MPDYSNEAIRATLDRIVPFDYEKWKKDYDHFDLIDRGPVRDA